MMKAFSNSDILNLWDHGAGLHPLDRTLLTLSSVCAPDDDCAEWPLGRRNRRLFEVHASCFGQLLTGWSSCPQCGEKIEFGVDSALLVTASQANGPGTEVTIRGEPFRLPTSRDVAAVLSGDAGTAAMRLLQRCSLGDGSGDEWREEEIRNAEEILSAADPLAETKLALNCPTCAHQWEDVLDIGCFVWAEIESRGRRLLWEVHALASAYGWSETETLALSATRRRLYLEMVQA